jgi:hypothetical protein
VGNDGRVEQAFSVRRPRSGYPYLCWFDRAEYFFAVENQGAGHATLRFFGGENGKSKLDIPLNPVSLFPYDEAKYRSLGRDSWALVLSDFTQSVGSLMDEWSSIEFDDNSDVLKLMVYRPIGEMFDRRSQSVCRVQENWVEVRLRPE